MVLLGSKRRCAGWAHGCLGDGHHGRQLGDSEVVATATDCQRSYVEQTNGPEKRRLAAACGLMARQHQRAERPFRSGRSRALHRRNVDARPRRRTRHDRRCAGALFNTAGVFNAHAARARRDGTGISTLWAAGGDEQAIQLVTHHGAKGLEWPVVIAMDLDATLKPRLWGLTVTPSPHTIDLSNPLAGRTLRYWPKFTGGQSSNVPILARIDDSPEGRIANEREIEESKRLLYVSLTRPRDTLIITTNTTKQSGPWMDTLNADWMLPKSDSLTLPTGKSIRSANLVPDEIEPTAIDNYQPQWLVGLDAQLETLPLGLSPSAAPALENTTIGKVIELGERLSIIGDYAPDKLGLAMHAVIACYINGNDNKNGTIARILVEHGMQDTISASVAIESAERLIKAIETHFSPILYATELPIRYQNIHGQLLNGWIDLLVETRNGYIIIDHKASPRARSDWEEVALSYSGQLAAYAKAVSRSTAKPVAGCWVHFGVTGGLVEVHTG